MHDTFAPRRQVLVSHNSDNRDVSLSESLAGRKLVEAISALDPLRRLVLGWQLGLHGSAADAMTISCRLALPVERVDRLIAEALEELGWELVAPTPHATHAEVAA